MLVVLLFLARPTLRQGDDPYKILGVSKSASPAEIKAQFRRLTLELHPDANKGRDTTAQWVQINDAYEILKNPGRKSLFDRFGSVGDTAPPPSDTEKGLFDDLHEWFFHRPLRTAADPNTTLLTSQTVTDFLNTDDEVLVLIYSSVMCDECDSYLSVFEDFARESRGFAKFGRVDVASGENVAKHFRVTGMPTIVYYKRSPNGRPIIDHIPHLISSFRDAVEFYASHWGVRVRPLANAADLSAFLGRKEGIPKVVQFVRRDAATLNFLRLAASYRSTVGFAVIDDLAFPTHQYPITSFPSWVVYRHSSALYRTVTTLDDLRATLDSWAVPTMVRLGPENFASICHEKCLVRVGKPTVDLVRRLCTINFSTGWISATSTQAEALGARPGSWILLRPSAGKFAIVTGVASNVDEAATLLTAVAHGLVEQPIPKSFKMQSDAAVILQRAVKKVRKAVARMDYSLRAWSVLTAAMAVYASRSGWRWWAQRRRESHSSGPVCSLEGEQQQEEQPEAAEEQIKEKTD
jgi:hypothetical protein